MSSGVELLRQLGSQAVPGLAPAVTQTKSSANLDFAALLSQARAGKIASGREVGIARGVDVNLTRDQLTRLSAAADLAESQGATRALVHIDGMSLKLDVAMREVTGAVNLKSAGVLTGIDAVIDVPADEAQQARPAALPAAISNSSLLSTLAQRIAS